ncbi:MULTISPECIES: RES family NAD+ phosphorylase [unclassified Rhizobium]
MSPPLPPADFQSRKLQIVSIAVRSVMHRFYTSTFEPVYFDRSDLGRFNAPDGSYGVLYTARNIEGAFAETFLRTPGNPLIDIGFLKRKAYVRLSATRDLRMVNLTGQGLAVAGATAEVPHSGLPYRAPQAWSRAIFDHGENVDGIAYHARHDDTQVCYAIFDRADPAVSETARKLNLDADWFWRVAEEYGSGLAP